MSPSHHRLVENHLLSKVPIFAPDTRAREVVAHLTDKKHGFESVLYIYAVENKCLIGILSIKELLQAHADAKISDIMISKLVVVHAGATLERAAIVAIQNGIKAVPVVDHSGAFLGVIGADTILHTLHREHTEDLLRIGGIEIVEQKHILKMLSDKVTHLLRIRTPWLVLGMLGGFIATLVAGFFEQAIAKEAALVFFIPVIVYMSDAVGTQTQTLFIRALAVRKISLLRYLAKEIVVDIVLGLMLGLLIAGFGLFWQRGSAVVPLIVGLSMAINVVIAGVVAIIISWLLKVLKRDPAIGAGPFATVVQDILSLVVYFVVASLML